MDPTNTNTALASAMIEELARCGVRHAVVSPGSRSTPLAVALWRQSGIDVMIAVDERSAGFFALGAAQSTGRPVVLLCTSGTAAANYHPAVAEADLSAVPMIVLTADRPPELRGIGAGQTIDQIKLYGPAVRWFCEVGTQAADDKGLLHFRATACRAFAASSGDPRPGPVHLDVPLRDPLAPVPVEGAVTARSRLALEGRQDGPLTGVVRAEAGLSDASSRALAGLLSRSQRILVLAGRQASVESRAPVAAFAAAAQAAVLAEPTSQLRCGPYDRSRVVSAYDRIAGDPKPELAPDLIVRIGEMPTSKNLRTWLASIEDLHQVVIDPGYGWNEPLRTADLILRADPAATLDAMSAMRAGAPAREFLDAWLEADERAADEISHEVESGRAQAGAVHRVLAGLLSDGDVVYTASSMAIRDQEYFLTGSDTDLLYLANRGANGIDGLLAAGIGSAVATGRATTIITGDLGFQHDVGSLALMASSKAPVRVIVVNDGGGRIFTRLPQHEAMDREEFDSLMRTPGGLDVRSAAGTFGTAYRRVADPSQLPEAFTGDSAVIEVPIDA